MFCVRFQVEVVSSAVKDFLADSWNLSTASPSLFPLLICQSLSLGLVLLQVRLLKIFYQTSQHLMTSILQPQVNTAQYFLASFTSVIKFVNLSQPLVTIASY